MNMLSGPAGSECHDAELHSPGDRPSLEHGAARQHRCGTGQWHCGGAGQSRRADGPPRPLLQTHPEADAGI